MLTGNRGAPTTGGEDYAAQVAAELGTPVRWLHVYAMQQALTGVGLLPRVGPYLAGVLLAPLAWLPGLVVEDEHASAALVWLNWLRRGPTVMIVHHLDGDFSSPWGRLWRRWRLSGVDRVVAVSEATRQDVLSLGLPPDRVRVIPPGFVAEDLPRLASRDHEGPLRVLAVGNCTSRKGFQVLLSALAKLPAGAVRTRVLGSTDEPFYRQVLLPLASPHCTFEGRVSRRVLCEAYAWADLLVLPSLREGWSIVASEALYCGLPVLASDLPCLDGRVVAGETGWLFPAGDAAALAALLASADRATLRRMGVAARARVRPEHDWSATRRRFAEVVREVWR